MNTTTLVPSPCVNICRMNEATGLCEGCLRTLDEIACWSLLDETEKREVWQGLAQRREVLARHAPDAPGAPGAPIVPPPAPGGAAA